MKSEEFWSLVRVTIVFLILGPILIPAGGLALSLVFLLALEWMK